MTSLQESKITENDLQPAKLLWRVDTRGPWHNHLQNLVITALLKEQSRALKSSALGASLHHCADQKH